jgi:hypothetical protein
MDCSSFSSGAAAEVQRASHLKEMLQACKYCLLLLLLRFHRDDEVPQLQDISDTLKAATGWQVSRQVAHMHFARAVLASAAAVHCITGSHGHQLHSMHCTCACAWINALRRLAPY